jgi:hypothetical protein
MKTQNDSGDGLIIHVSHEDLRRPIDRRIRARMAMVGTAKTGLIFAVRQRDLRNAYRFGCEWLRHCRVLAIMKASE